MIVIKYLFMVSLWPSPRPPPPPPLPCTASQIEDRPTPRGTAHTEDDINSQGEGDAQDMGPHCLLIY